MNSPNNLVDALKVLILWKKPIMIFVGIAFVASIITSLLLPEYYDSKCTFYPTNPMATERTTLFSINGREQAQDFYGSKNDVNHFMTLATSSNLLDYLINKFDLAKHYHEDTTKKLWRYNVKKELKSNYSAVKTEFGAIEISISDKDSVFGAMLTNHIVNYLDTLSTDLTLANKEKVLEVLSAKLKEKRQDVAKLSDSVATITQQHNIVEASVTNGDAIRVTGDNPQSVEAYKILRSQLKAAILDLNSLTTLYDQHDAATKDRVSNIFVIEKAYPAERRSWPVRWLIVVASTIAALFFGIVGALLIGRVREIKAELDA